jgi:Predicted periplasmic protein
MRYFKLFCLLAAVAFFLAGCSRSDSTSSTAQTAPPESAAPESPESSSAPVSAPPISGSLTISFPFERQSGSASNQFAVWIENGADGEHIRTLYATAFTANGGWKIREQSLPVWVEQFGVKERTSAEIDAVTGATPAPGTLTYTWDGTDESGALVAAGEYRVVVEGSLRWENQVQYTCLLTLEDTEQSGVAEAVYSGGSDAEHGMLGAVEVTWTPE